jgi:hypothetical protein
VLRWDVSACRTSRFDCGPTNGGFRRLSPVASRPSEGRLTQGQRSLRLDGRNWSSCPFPAIGCRHPDGSVGKRASLIRGMSAKTNVTDRSTRRTVARNEASTSAHWGMGEMATGSKPGTSGLEVTTATASTEKRAEKVADALVFALIVTVQLARPRHAPPQPKNPQA